MDYKEKIAKYPLHWALGGSDASGGLEQNAEELEMLCKFIEEKGIKTYLEIGIAKGDLLRFMQDEMGLSVVGITPFQLPTHNGLDVIYAKSQDVTPSENYDLIFVDGAHDYESVKSDYERYKGNCKYMAFHDLLGYRDCHGVSQLWSEIKNNYEHWELKASKVEHQSGIGIIKI